MMTRSSFRPIASIGLVAAVLGYIGCSKTYQTSEKPSGSTNVSAGVDAQGGSRPPTPITEKKEVEAKFITEWSVHPPAGILLISGEQNGYPVPCGCTDGQLGGLGRRYDLLDKLKAKGWPVAKIDLGDLIRYRADSRGGNKQERIKFEIIFEALGMMKYDAVVLGVEDLRLDVNELVGFLVNSQPPRFPVFLSANVRPTDKELANLIAPIKFTQAGPVTIGVTSILDPATFEEVQANTAGLLEVKPPDEVIPGLLDEMVKKKVQVKVLMVQGPHDLARQYAEKYPDFEIVVGTSKSEDPDEHADSVNQGKTLLIDNIGKKGKYVGVVGFFPGSTPMIQFRRQPLDQEHFHEAEPIAVLINRDYQDRLKQERVVENFPRFANSAFPAGATYIGADSCKECHPKTYAKWTTTKHAKAYEPLTNPKRERIFDAECISCHTTGFGYKTGWVSAEATSWLKGNQCENCHGPASLHAEAPDNLDFRKPMALPAQVANNTNFCTKCHDTDNDHNFTFDGRYAQIFHKGLDEYTDPKVHQGRKFKAPGPAAK